MANSEERLTLSARYIHTGNSGVTLTVRRDVVNTERAELEVEAGAFGAFRSSIKVRGNESYGMTSVQLRDLGLMFLDAAELLDTGGRVPLRQGGSVNNLGRDNKADIVREGGGRSQRDLPKSLERYIPDRLSGIALDPDIDLSRFAQLRKAEEEDSGKGGKEGGQLKKAFYPKKTAAEVAEAKKKLLEQREKWVRESHILQCGYDYLMAKRLSDLVTPLLEKARSNYLEAENVKFAINESDIDDDFPSSD